MSGPLFPSTTTTQTPNLAFKTTKTVVSTDTKGSGSMLTPCLDKAMQAQGGGEDSRRMTGGHQKGTSQGLQGGVFRKMEKEGNRVVKIRPGPVLPTRQDKTSYLPKATPVNWAPGKVH